MIHKDQRWAVFDVINHITIEGSTRLAFTEDVAARFLGYGWYVTCVGNANDLEMLMRA
jgi:transketolase